VAQQGFPRIFPLLVLTAFPVIVDAAGQAAVAAAGLFLLIPMAQMAVTEAIQAVVQAVGVLAPILVQAAMAESGVVVKFEFIVGSRRINGRYRF
jgi:hypothetical protein